MIQSFADQGTEDIYNGKNTPKARRTLPRELWTIAHRKLDYLRRAQNLMDLALPPSNRLEVLKGDRKGQHSIRINDRYRVCFTWTDAGPANLEIVDYH